MPFLQKRELHLTYSGRRSAIYKVPPRIGGHHFLLCQHTNTKDIAGQSATLMPGFHMSVMEIPLRNTSEVLKLAGPDSKDANKQ